MASLNLSARSWLSVQRLGADTLRLRDGSLRAVLECAAPTAHLAGTIGALDALVHPVQIALQARRQDSAAGAAQLIRLRVSYARMLAALRDDPLPLIDRLLVAVPWDAGEGERGEAVLGARLWDVGERLERAGLEPIRLTGDALDALIDWPEIAEGRCEIRVGDRFARTLAITAHPERFDRSWLGAMDAEHDLSLHVRSTVRGLRRTSAYLSLWAGSRCDLDTATRRAEEALFAHGIGARRLHLQAEPALVSGLPLGLDLVAGSQPQPVRNARSDSPQAAGDAPGRSRKALQGVDPGSSRPLEIDRFAQPNANVMVLGAAGSGRTFLVQLELMRARLAGLDACVIDPLGEHAAIVSALGGVVVAPSADGRTPFDPFTVTGGAGALDARIEALAALVDLLGLGLPPALRPVVRDAIAFAYAAHGHVEEGTGEDAVPLLLGDLVASLERRAATAGGSLGTELEVLVRRLDRYLRGEGRWLFQPPAALPRTRAPLAAYSPAGLPEEDRPAAMLLSLDQAWSWLRGDRSALVMMDGIDALLEHEVVAGWVAGLMGSAGRWRAGLMLVAGDTGGVLGGRLRDGVLDAGMKVLLRQQPEDASLLADVFHLTPPEQSWLANAEVGEGLLLAQGKRLPFKAIASDEELRLINEGGAR